jgi:molecular chaperone DnaK (HSP70)
VSARFVVGVDLGTTHTVVAYAPRDGSAAPRVFDVPQLVSASEVEALPLLASTLYAPLEGEVARLPFHAGDGAWCAGAYAKRRGVEVPGRVVTSSKSWLSNARVDRTAPILPWRAGGDADAERELGPRLSPVDAAARVLSHVAAAWDAAHPKARLAAQDVVLTVPASFDAFARELTLEAVARAALTVRLLEEPQAAFYAYLAKEGARELEEIVVDGPATVLVCDVGGGTTDLSLFRVKKAEGAAAKGAHARPIEVARVAVGHHLLLGGDNMDLALAHVVEKKLTKELDAARFAALVAACRSAKESLLGAAVVDAVPIRLAGRGAALIGGTLSAELTRADAEAAVLEGFWPLAPRDARPVRGGGALVAFGLAYERDPAITRHVAHFFRRHAGDGDGDAPRALLLNGGVFHAPRIVERLAEVVGAWSDRAPRVLSHEDPDRAVALGAVRYGLARLGHGARIEAGAPRGYYVGLAEQKGEAQKVVCVVPRGAAEGAVHAVADRTFALKIGRPVRFDLFASDEASDAAGAVVDLALDRFDALPPALVAFERAGGAGEARVTLEGEITAIGTLDLACVADDGARMRLAFDLRGGHAPASIAPPSMSPRSLRASTMPPSGLVKTLSEERRAVENERLASARAAIERVFGKGHADVAPRAVKDLVRDLEKTLGERASWDTTIARGLADVLVSNARSRKRGSDHERVFWMLTGFCLRPGFGDPNDGARVAELAPLFDEKLAFAGELRGWQQLWIAWRRVAGGLDEATQLKVRDVADPFLAPAEKRLKKPKGWKGDALPELLELATSLERVPATRRSELGGWVLERTWTDRDPRLWAAIGRLGARAPAYASAHHVVAPFVAERWLDHLLREKSWEARELQIAARELARVTGDRARDVGEGVRREVERRLAAAGAPEPWRRAVRELVEQDDSASAAFYGEALPVGLRLVG